MRSYDKHIPWSPTSNWDSVINVDRINDVAAKCKTNEGRHEVGVFEFLTL